MSNFRVGAWPVNPDPGSFVSQQTQIAPVRIFARDDSARERLARDHSGDINQFFDAAHRQHMLSGRGFSAQRQNFGPVEMVYLNNNGQPQVVVTPEPEVVEVEDPREITIPPGYRTIERYMVRIEYVELIHVIYSYDQDQQSIFYPDQPSGNHLLRKSLGWTNTANFRKRFIIESPPFPRLGFPGVNEYAYSFFTWALMNLTLPPGERPEGYDPLERVAFLAARNYANIWSLFLNNGPLPNRGVPPPVPMPTPVVLQSWLNRVEVRGVGLNLAYQDPSLAPIAEWLDERLATTIFFPFPPLVP